MEVDARKELEMGSSQWHYDNLCCTKTRPNKGIYSNDVVRHMQSTASMIPNTDLQPPVARPSVDGKHWNEVAWFQVYQITLSKIG